MDNGLDIRAASNRHLYQFVSIVYFIQDHKRTGSIASVLSTLLPCSIAVN